MAGTSSDPSENPSFASSNFSVDDAFVAPWGLANEERPMHLLWDGDVKNIEIRFAEPVDLLEAYNLVDEIDTYASQEEHDDGTKVCLVKIQSDDLETAGYLSIKFRVPKIFDETMVGQRVEVRFNANNEEHILETYTFTIRPQIQLIEEPDIVVLNENEELDSINIQMRYIGFGLAHIDIEARAEGELISEGESLYHDIAKAMFASGFHELEAEDLEPVPENWKEETGAGIHPEALKEIVQGVRDLLTEGTAFDEFDQEELHQMADLLEEDSEDRELTPVYEHIEIMLLDSILDVVDRHPTENVQLTEPRTKVEIDSRINEFIITYKLEDNQGNKYDSIEVPIEVEDNRENGGPVETGIDTDWDHHELDPDEVLKDIMEDL